MRYLVLAGVVLLTVLTFCARVVAQPATAEAPAAEPLPPPISLADLVVFPSAAETRAALAYASCVRAMLVQARDDERVDPGFYVLWLEKFDAAMGAWQYLDWTYDLRWKGYSYLPQLRRDLGVEAYYAGRMPSLEVYPPRPWAPWLR